MKDAGELNRRITFQVFRGQRDDWGDLPYHDDAAWQDAFTVWGSLRTISGREFYASAQSESQVTHNVFIRHREGVLAEMRLRCGGHTYRILSPAIDPDGKQQLLQLKVTELVP